MSLINFVASLCGAGGIQAFKTMRTLRALRPLRAMSRMQGMRVRTVDTENKTKFNLHTLSSIFSPTFCICPPIKKKTKSEKKKNFMVCHFNDFLIKILYRKNH